MRVGSPHPWCLWGTAEWVPPVDSGCHRTPCSLPAASVPHILGFWKPSQETLLSALLGHTDRSNIQDEGDRQPHKTLPAEHSHGEWSTCLPLPSPGLAPDPGFLEPPLGRKPVVKGSFRPIYGSCQGQGRSPQAGSPPSMQHHAGCGMPRWGPRDLQAGQGSRGQPGSGEHAKHQKDFPRLHVGCLSSSGFALYFEFCFLLAYY